MPNQFDFVSVMKKPIVHYSGRSISHVLTMEDGTKKTIGVILPSEQPLVFETHVDENIEITSGNCLVKIGNDKEYKQYRTGESFKVLKNSIFKIQANEVIDYVCHFD